MKKQPHKKIVQEEKQEVKKKWQAYRLPLLVMAAVFLVIILIATYQINIAKENLQQTWATLGRTWHMVVAENPFVSDLKVKDLGPLAENMVKATLGDKDALPDFLKKNRDEEIRTLDMLPIRVLPDRLKKTVLTDYELSKLESQMEKGQTEASPWLAASLGRLYFMKEQPEKSLAQYKSVIAKYSDHPVVALLEQVQAIDRARQEIKWLKQHEVAELTLIQPSKSDKKVILTTNKGEVVIVLYQKQYPVATANFLQLAESRFYDGLNFYEVTPDRIYTGCPMGNGKGGPGYTKMAKIKDVIIQRGVVAMDNYGKPGKIGSRFFIFKKYPWSGQQENYSLLGVVREGMNVIDQLTSADVLLGISVVTSPQ